MGGNWVIKSLKKTKTANIFIIGNFFTSLKLKEK